MAKAVKKSTTNASKTSRAGPEKVAGRVGERGPIKTATAKPGKQSSAGNDMSDALAAVSVLKVESFEDQVVLTIEKIKDLASALLQHYKKIEKNAAAKAPKDKLTRGKRSKANESTGVSSAKSKNKIRN